MSLIHYTPDTTVVPCLGCNELIRDEDLVKMSSGQLIAFPSAFFWHPFHFWCVRAAGRPTSRFACADCGVALDAEAFRAAVAWARLTGNESARGASSQAEGKAKYSKIPTVRCLVRPGCASSRST